MSVWGTTKEELKNRKITESVFKKYHFYNENKLKENDIEKRKKSYKYKIIKKKKVVFIFKILPVKV